MEEKYKIIDIRYGIGYGTHTTDIEVPKNITPEELEAWVGEHVMERVWWSYEGQGA